jgi:hypothetical protein
MLAVAAKPNIVLNCTMLSCTACSHGMLFKLPSDSFTDFKLCAGPAASMEDLEALQTNWPAHQCKTLQQFSVTCRPLYHQWLPAVICLGSSARAT